MPDIQHAVSATLGVCAFALERLPQDPMVALARAHVRHAMAALEGDEDARDRADAKQELLDVIDDLEELSEHVRLPAEVYSKPETIQFLAHVAELCESMREYLRAESAA